MGTPRTRLAAWEKPKEITSCDAASLRSVHKHLYIHNKKVESARGTISRGGHYDFRRLERDAELHRKRAESMRITRERNREVAVAEKKKDNVKLVERLVHVMKDSEKRLKEMQTPRQPASTHPEAGSLNIVHRRQVARHIDEDNVRLMSRLMSAGPTLATTDELQGRYCLHEELVGRCSRLRRGFDAELDPPDARPSAPSTPRARPPLHAPKQVATLRNTSASSAGPPRCKQSPRSLPPLELQANTASDGGDSRAGSACAPPPSSSNSSRVGTAASTSRNAPAAAKASGTQPASPAAGSRSPKALESPYANQQLPTVTVRQEPTPRGSNAAARAEPPSLEDGEAAAARTAQSPRGQEGRNTEKKDGSESSSSRSRSSSRSSRSRSRSSSGSRSRSRSRSRSSSRSRSRSSSRKASSPSRQSRPVSGSGVKVGGADPAVSSKSPSAVPSESRASDRSEEEKPQAQPAAAAAAPSQQPQPESAPKAATPSDEQEDFEEDFDEESGSDDFEKDSESAD